MKNSLNTFNTYSFGIGSVFLFTKKEIHSFKLIEHFKNIIISTFLERKWLNMQANSQHLNQQIKQKMPTNVMKLK